VLLDDGDSRPWIIKALREAGSSVASEFAGLDEESLRIRTPGSDLSLKEIAAHLRDAEDLAGQQIMCVLDQPGRTIPHQDIDLLPMERDYRQADIRGLIAAFRSARRETVLVLWGLVDSDWDLSGQHPYRGDITVETIARELAQHDLEHLWQVRRLKAELNVRVRVSDDWDDPAAYL